MTLFIIWKRGTLSYRQHCASQRKYSSASSPRYSVAWPLPSEHRIRLLFQTTKSKSFSISSKSRQASSIRCSRRAYTSCSKQRAFLLTLRRRSFTQRSAAQAIAQPSASVLSGTRRATPPSSR